MLRAVIDQRRCEGELAGQYLPLGSASGVLLRQSSESLAGRMAQLEQPLRNGQTWVVEIKRSSAPTVSKGFHLAAADVGATRKLLVGGVAEFGLTPASRIQ